MSVTWVKNGDGKYLVESNQHLLQVMNQGTLYTNEGTPPTDYLASSYLQTSDIDLVNDHASIVPIGKNADTNKFTGEYNGGLFTISNWKYTGNLQVYDAGLFGCCDGATLEHVRLAGVWAQTLGGARSGFLCGTLKNSVVTDVEGNFSQGSVSRGNTVGGLLGMVTGGTLDGLSILGTIGIPDAAGNVGGIAGYINSATLSHCRNLATFPGGITGNGVGGIVGWCLNSTLSKCLNAMTGDMIGQVFNPETSSPDSGCGGICGFAYGNMVIDLAVNSMVGNLKSDYAAGGIIGSNHCFSSNSDHTRLLNYMRGDVTGDYASGGMIGIIDGYSGIQFSLTLSVVAMQGTVDKSVDGVRNVTPVNLQVTVVPNFGMTYSSDNGSNVMVVDNMLVYHPDFTDLPYFVLSGTYDWDFVYANIGGKDPEYTHLSVHTGQVSAPYFTDFGLATDNTVVYLTYANTGTNTLHYSDALTVVETVATDKIPIVRPETKDSFLFGDVYDITEAGPEVEAATNDLFTTGDRVGVAVNGAPTTTTFVNRGGDISIAGVSALLLPFDPAVTDVQDATLTLSDATFVDVGFDQASGQISVGGTPYSDGEYFIMDGQKVTVRDI